jgi:antitoxin ParD1/3/4
MNFVSKKIALTDNQDKWLSSKIAHGEYADESELVRELISERQIAESPQEIEYIRNALIHAEHSGLCDKSIDDAWQIARQRSA